MKGNRMEKWKLKLKNRRFAARFFAAVLLLCLFTGLSVYTVFIKPGQNKDTVVYKEETVKRGDLILGIMESGSVTLEETDLAYTLELDVSDEEDAEDDEQDDEDEETVKYPELEEVYVAAGQRIEEGDALFRLTEESMTAVRKKLKSLYTEAKIAYAEAETGYRIQLLSAKSTYDESLLSAQKAQSSYDAASTISKEKVNRLSADIRVLEAEIAYNREQLEKEKLWESLEEAQTAFAAAKKVYESTDVHNATAYADNYAEYKDAKDRLENIQDQIDTLNESVSDSEESIAEKNKELSDAQAGLEAESLNNKNDYDSAVLSGELAEDIYGYTQASLLESVRAAETDMEEAEEQQNEFEAFAGEDGIVYADGAGLVTDVLYEAGDDLVRAGTVLTYVKEGACTVSIDVAEEDVPSIKVGDQVDVTIPAFPDTAFKGTVSAVTTTAASRYAATVSYPVTVKIEGDTSLLYGGMTAEVTFVTDSVSDVLYISKKAIRTADGKSYVYVDAGAGKKKLIEVETGFSDGTNVEIVSGLSQGDTVYIESRISGSEKELTEGGPETGSQDSAAPEKTMEETGQKEHAGQSGGMPGEMKE